VGDWPTWRNHLSVGLGFGKEAGSVAAVAAVEVVGLVE